MFTRKHISVVLLFVLAVRALLPAGFMVRAANAGDGSFDIVICTSTGQKVLTVDADGTPLPAKPQASDHGVCAFATSSAAALASAPAALVHTADYAAATYTLAVALFAETPKPGATSARGPPSSLI